MAFFQGRKPPLTANPASGKLPSGRVAPEDVCRRLCRQALLWERYLYEDHTRKQLAAWARRLNYFRFCRAHGGHASDGDQLLALLLTPDEAALQTTCQVLGIPLRPMPPEAELATIPFGDRPSSSRHFPAWQQPRHVEIAGARVFCWFTSHRINDPSGRFTGEVVPALQLSVADRDNAWDVTEAAVTQAEALERLLLPLAAQIHDPPQDDRNCICPRYDPEMFGLWHRATAPWPWDEPDPR